MGYAISRLIQVAFFPDPDPRAVMTVLRIGFFWRAAIAGYAGILGSIGAFAAHVRYPAVIDRWMPRLVIATIALGSVQGIFAP
ncbi:MAG: hypothetical protein ACXWUG_24720 [Polyangiales bacterium]